MAYTAHDLLKRILDTKALAIWDRAKGPVFWYTAGVPGPFFVNTEWIIGTDLSAKLVNGISAIMEQTPDAGTRAARINAMIMSAYDASEVYHQVIGSMIDKTRASFAPNGFTLISGGERRDWLFSIPLAHELGLSHVFLFKDLSAFCETPVAKGSAVLHVADLINNAASYFERWFPALEKAGLHCTGTVCVNSRGTGAKKLEQAGIKVAALVTLDIEFFRQSQKNGLIDAETLAEIECHEGSPAAWAEQYLIGRDPVFDVGHVDTKSFERMQTFFTQDPWTLQPKHEAVFARMRAAIAERKAKIA
ncbi:MAG: hypothetical protein M3N08_03795 [Pseudomonadota bacterium]|nr:hypothetical protein [Pseudomonadota bacterium]